MHFLGEVLYLSNPTGIPTRRLRKKLLMEFKRLPSLTESTLKANGLFSKKEQSERAMLKWNERQISLCSAFPFSVPKCLPPRNPLWNLIRLQGLHNVWRWAQINFLHLLWCCKSFIGTNVLQSQAKENSWKINTAKYTALSCGNLQGFTEFKLRGIEAVRAYLFIWSPGGKLNSIHGATEARHICCISSHIVWLTLFCGHRFLGLIQQTTWEVHYHNGKWARWGGWMQVYSILLGGEKANKGRNENKESTLPCSHWALFLRRAVRIKYTLYELKCKVL